MGSLCSYIHSTLSADLEALPDCPAPCSDRSEAPRYVEGQQIWLSTRDIPLKVDAPKMNPRFIGPDTISKVVNRSAVYLNLPSTFLSLSKCRCLSFLSP